MATLTWQDVAGQVRAPDYGDSSAMITKGIENLGAGVKNLITGPEQARQADLARQLMIIDSSKQAGAEMADVGSRIAATAKTNRKEGDIEEYGSVASALEAGARDFIASGKGDLNAFLAQSELYAGLDAGARTVGGRGLSEAGYQGDNQRRQAQQDARQQAQWAAGHQLQRQQLALSAQNARIAAGDRAEARAERKADRAALEALKPKVWKTGNDKTDRAMSRLAMQTGQNYIEASGAAYDGQTVTSTGKNYENLGAVSDIFNSLNTQRVKAGKPPLPLNTLKRILDTGVGLNSFWNGTNKVDDAAITGILQTAGDQYDTALKGKEYYERLSGLVDGGVRPDQSHIDHGWNQMFPKQEAKPPPRSDGVGSNWGRTSAY